MGACSSTPRSCRRGRSSTSSGPSWTPPRPTDAHGAAATSVRATTRRRRRRGATTAEIAPPAPPPVLDLAPVAHVHLMIAKFGNLTLDDANRAGRRPDPGRVRVVDASTAAPWLQHARVRGRTPRSGSTSRATSTRSTPWREGFREVAARLRLFVDRRVFQPRVRLGSVRPGATEPELEARAGEAGRGSRPTRGGRPASRCSPPPSTVPTSRPYKTVADIPLGPHVVH